MTGEGTRRVEAAAPRDRGGRGLWSKLAPRRKDQGYPGPEQCYGDAASLTHVSSPAGLALDAQDGWAAMPQNQILIADDDPLLRAVLEHKLAAAGYAVLSVEDGRAALDAARLGRPAAIVLDAMMPVMDGFEALRRLKADPTLKDMPVVMLTALKREDDVVSALKLGASDYVAKPFNPDELVARLDRLVPAVRTGA